MLELEGGRPVWQRACLLAASLLLALAFGVSAADAQQQPTALQAPVEETRSAPAPRSENPYQAYEKGLYEQALQGFTDLQVEYPENSDVEFNVGSAHYQMRNYPEADRAFAAAALAGDPTLRAQALYNMGNSAYRQGRLQEAVELYKSALEVDPEDEDAKFNLEFVRDEIRRRHEEAKKRQEQQQQDGQDQQRDEKGGEEEQQPEQGQPQQPQGGRDTDRDGLPDEVEEAGENPTDPLNPDSDGDTLPDGAEDTNRNGRVDEAETDPNNPDSDGDGVPDAQEAAGSGEAGQESAAEQREMTPEEAERYLQALEEGRPVRQQPQGGRRSRTDKDW